MKKKKDEDTDNYKAKGQNSFQLMLLLGEVAIAKLKAIVCYLVDFEKLR